MPVPKLYLRRSLHRHHSNVGPSVICKPEHGEAISARPKYRHSRFLIVCGRSAAVLDLIPFNAIQTIWEWVEKQRDGFRVVRRPAMGAEQVNLAQVDGVAKEKSMSHDGVPVTLCPSHSMHNKYLKSIHNLTKVLFAFFYTSTLGVVAGLPVFRLSGLDGISDTSDMTAVSCGPESVFGLSQHPGSDQWEVTMGNGNAGESWSLSLRTPAAGARPGGRTPAPRGGLPAPPER